MKEICKTLPIMCVDKCIKANIVHKIYKISLCYTCKSMVVSDPCIEDVFISIVNGTEEPTRLFFAY